jgi:hypothetical protein
MVCGLLDIDQPLTGFKPEPPFETTILKLHRKLVKFGDQHLKPSSKDP